MAQIQPVQVWYQGEQRDATVFNLISNYDNLQDSATFQYQLIEVITVLPEQQNSNVLIIGYLTINGADYEQWDAEVNANAWIYQWAADKLGLTIITL
jgi:hypothetical protein